MCSISSLGNVNRSPHGHRSRRPDAITSVLRASTTSAADIFGVMMPTRSSGPSTRSISRMSGSRACQPPSTVTWEHVEKEHEHAGPGIGGELLRRADAVGFRSQRLRPGRAHDHVLERLNRLRLAVFEDFEVLGAQIQHGLSALCRIHVDPDEVGLGAERGRLLRILGRLRGAPDGPLSSRRRRQGKRKRREESAIHGYSPVWHARSRWPDESTPFCRRAGRKSKRSGIRRRGVNSLESGSRASPALSGGRRTPAPSSREPFLLEQLREDDVAVLDDLHLDGHPVRVHDPAHIGRPASQRPQRAPARLDG